MSRNGMHATEANLGRRRSESAGQRPAAPPDLPEGYRTTELGPLPEEWQVLRLRDAVVPTKQVNPARNPTRVIKYVDVSSIDRGFLRITGYEEYRGSDAPSRAKKAVRVGDVIFATVRPSLKRVLPTFMCTTPSA